MSGIESEVLAALPVRVAGVEVQDPVLVFFGEGWSLTIACPWTGMVRGNGLSWEDDDLEDRVWDLVGDELVSIQQEGRSIRFGFLGGTLLATPDTDLDPWVLRLPGGLLVGRVL
jgi:hypothetical protein